VKKSSRRDYCYECRPSRKLINFSCVHCLKRKKQSPEAYVSNTRKTCSMECDIIIKDKIVNDGKKTISMKPNFFDWAIQHVQEIKDMRLTPEELESKMIKITEKQYAILAKETKLIFNA